MTLRSFAGTLSERESALLKTLFEHLDAIAALRIAEGSIHPESALAGLHELARAVALLGPAPAGPFWPALSAEVAKAVSVSHPDEMKPNMTHRITVVIHDQTLLCYQAAARQLQRRLGEAAPSVEELIAYELTSKRTVKSIMDEYTDSQRRARR